MILLCLAGLLVIPAENASASSRKAYWLKVNRHENVVTVYSMDSSGKYQPLKAFLCSCGKAGHRTPIGTGRIGNKLRWSSSVASEEYMQFFTQFDGQVGFHSTCYLKPEPDTLEIEDHNLLGKAVSHGCVRLHLKDAKWIFDNCPKGTKVTVYESDDPGPLGKPPLVEATCGYDPTNRAHRSTYELTGPEIRISRDKVTSLTAGDTFFPMANVTARDPYTYENLTSKVKYRVYRYSKKKKSYKHVLSLNTNKPGKYRVDYTCEDARCGEGTAKASLTVTIKEKKEDKKDKLR